LLVQAVSILALTALLAPVVCRLAGRTTGYLLAAVVGLTAVYFASQVPAVAEGQALRQSIAWIPELGVLLSFSLDGLSLLFALLVTGVGLFIALYASSYLQDDALLGRFYAYLMGFMASMLGLVLADNIITLFIFWELTSITSYLLIGFDHKDAKARKAALQALLVTGSGGLALLAGLVLLQLASGTGELSSMLASGFTASGSELYTPIVVLVLIGAFTKSAQVPFHFWLPGAMTAPSPVSAYLHSSTMVKAGVYLLARLSPILGGGSGGPQGWTITLSVVGGLTMLWGAFVAARQTHFKRVLAYSTVSSLGMMVMLIGAVSAAPVAGAAAAAAAGLATYILAHACFKGALFMVAGAVDHAIHIKDVEHVGGLARVMPFTAAAAVTATISMMGVPPLLGFAAKEQVLVTMLAGGPGSMLGTVLVVATALASVLTVLLALLVGLKPFIGPLMRTSEPPHEGPVRLWLGPVALGVAGLVAGVAPWLFAEPIVRAAAVSIVGIPRGDAVAVPANLSLGHLLHLGPALFISLGAIAAGAGLFVLRARWRAITASLERIDWLTAERAYEAIFHGGVLGLAALSTRVFQNGSLRVYIRIVMLAVLASVGLALAGSGAAFLGRDLLGDVKADTTAIEGVLVALIIAGAVAATLVGSRLAAIVSVGLVGYCIALLFVVFGAPDVAMTQFAVETLSVIILLLVVFRMPRFNGKSSRPARVLDAGIAAGMGVLMTGLVLAAQSNLAAQPISHFFAERSLTEGYGRNVVNVILVDFRALDTMGEITVLGIAAVGIWTLLRIRPTRSTDLSASVTAAGRGPAAAGHASGIAAAGDGKDGVPS
jgi:multicomponent Na+:H+ antiporter subunit A